MGRASEKNGILLIYILLPFFTACKPKAKFPSWLFFFMLTSCKKIWAIYRIIYKQNVPYLP
jgi:hypothetical protein